MAKTERDQGVVAPKDCTTGSLVWDTNRDVPGVVMGHRGGDRVLLRALSGGTEWDAFSVRRPMAREELRGRLAVRNGASRWGL